MNIIQMKKADFKELPHISLIENVNKKFDSLIIIPEMYKHDSGYRCMSFVGCVDGEPVCIMGGGSDVLEIDGIGGYGKWYKNQNSSLPDKIDIKGWKIDCLPSGYLRIFTNGKHKITIGSMLSSFEIYAES